jgi:hypothetical protein
MSAEIATHSRLTVCTLRLPMRRTRSISPCLLSFHVSVLQLRAEQIFIPADEDYDDRRADWICERRKLRPRGGYV